MLLLRPWSRLVSAGLVLSLFAVDRANASTREAGVADASCNDDMCASPASTGRRVHVTNGVAVTGPNDRCAAPVWNIPGLAAGPDSHGTLLGLKDGSVAGEVIPLVPGDCDTPDPDALVATFVDSAYFAARGWPEPSEELLNLSLNSVPVHAGNGVFAPIPLAGSVPPNPLPPTHVDPLEPVRLEGWLKAGGKLKIVCKTDGDALLKITLKKLVPEGVYTVWGAWHVPASSELLVAPLGGMPNVVVANSRGRAKYQRHLQFCPLDLAPDSSILMYATVIYHADRANRGAIPAEPFREAAFLGVGPLPFLSTQPMGIVSFDHVNFRVRAEE